MEIVTLSVEDLMPYENNARKHTDDDVQTIINSIRDFGFNDPIGIWSDKNIIVEGHGRLMAAKKLGMTEVPCIRLDHLNDEQRRAYTLAHNKTTENSEWDFDTLFEELDRIIDIDMDDFGFEIFSEEKTFDSNDEDKPKKDFPQKVHSGDVWLLGDHRLMVGDDSTSANLIVMNYVKSRKSDEDVFLVKGSSKVPYKEVL